MRFGAPSRRNCVTVLSGGEVIMPTVRCCLPSLIFAVRVTPQPSILFLPKGDRARFAIATIRVRVGVGTLYFGVRQAGVTAAGGRNLRKALHEASRPRPPR